LIVGFAQNQKHKNFELDENIEAWFTLLHLWPRINPKKCATLVRNRLFISFFLWMAWSNCYIVVGLWLAFLWGDHPWQCLSTKATNLADQDKKKKIKKSITNSHSALSFFQGLKKCQIHWRLAKGGRGIYFQNLLVWSSVRYFILFYFISITRPFVWPALVGQPEQAKTTTTTTPQAPKLPLNKNTHTDIRLLRQIKDLVTITTNFNFK
jgi:hypothetical protein